MEFRWVAAIALWTILSGPIFNGRGTPSAPSREKVSANVVKPAATPASQAKNPGSTERRFASRP
jgi:hypothetical protein